MFLAWLGRQLSGCHERLSAYQYARDGSHEHTSLIIDVLCFCTSLQNRKSRKLYLVTKKLSVALPTEARNILKLSPGRTVLHSKSDQLRIKLNHKNEHNISNISIIIQFTMFVCGRSPCSQEAQLSPRDRAMRRVN